MIKKVEHGYVIASRGVWLPGCFEDARTARYAFRFAPLWLERLRIDANKRAGKAKGIITWGDLARARGLMAKL